MSHKVGDQRVIQKFCLLPREINGSIYWLEKIVIRQEYCRIEEYVYDYVEFDNVLDVYDDWKDLEVLIV